MIILVAAAAGAYDVATCGPVRRRRRREEREQLAREEAKKRMAEGLGGLNWLFYDSKWKTSARSRGQPTEFYHVTNYRAAMAIQKGGFRPSSGGMLGAGVCKCDSSFCGFANHVKKEAGAQTCPTASARPKVTHLRVGPAACSSS